MYLLCVYISTVCGCSRLSATRDPMPMTGILAEFRGGEIRESDLPRAEIFKAEYALYQTKLARINEAIEKKFLEHAAQKRGMSVEEFLKREVTSRVSITDEEVKKEYLQFVASVKDNPRFKNLPEQEKEEKALARLGLKPNFGKSFEVLVKEKFRALISKRREREEVQRLIKASGLKFYLTEPEPPVYDIPTKGHPTLGPATAPVTLVVFNDLSPSRTFEDAVMQKVTEIVRRRKLEQGRPGLMARLMGEFKGRIYLEEPRPPVYDIATNGYPALGSERASVTIVEFADFQCPFCQQAVQTLNQVVARYADRVRVVFRHFPLPSHAYAQKAHEAAECANEQGKFWAYHDAIFANQGALSVDDLEKYAANLGLDTGQFNQCLDTGKYAEKVKKDVEDGMKYNVRGTPTFFINGTPQRIQTFEQFAWHITGGKEGKPVPSALLAAAGGG